MITMKRMLLVAGIFAALSGGMARTGFAGTAGQATVIEQWGEVVAPEAVMVSPVAVDAAKTAFLVLDIEELTCNEQRRPRCLGTLPAISGFLSRAREKNLAVVYSLTPKGSPATILPAAAALAGEPLVQSSVDKFFNTELDGILKSRGIDTVIIAGTAAEGAVLHTATGAAMRGLKVIVAVDGISSSALYAEQYTLWHMLNAPGTRGKATLSRFELISF